MMFNWFKSKKEISKQALVIFGADFGSYQLLQLVLASSNYRVVGFVSADPWQHRSRFEKVGVIYPAELKALSEREKVLATIVPSDQQDEISKLLNDGLLGKLAPMLRYCEILEIPQEASKQVADNFLASLIRKDSRF